MDERFISNLKDIIIEAGKISISLRDEGLIVKRKKDTGSFGTPRNQSLILTSNNKDNIVLDPDGSTRIDDLRMGDMRFSTSNEPPRYVSERGHVVFNNNPNPGGPMGWICLGSANWANFGIID
jgi:hypothetical protein